MSVKLSVCGVYVIPGREPQQWQGGNYWEEIDELDLSVALNFTRVKVRAEALQNGLYGTSFIAAAFHPEWVEKCEDCFEVIDQPVIPEEEYQAYDHEMNPYTVCGFYRDNWQTYSSWVSAISPRMAYLTAFDIVRKTENGRYLYVACVHEGLIPRLPMPGTDQPPAFGDPMITDATAMAEEMDAIMEVTK